MSGEPSSGLIWLCAHGRADKGVLLRYIERMTGLSRQQATRLVRQYRKGGKLSNSPAPPVGFYMPLYCGGRGLAGRDWPSFIPTGIGAVRFVSGSEFGYRAASVCGLIFELARIEILALPEEKYGDNMRHQCCQECH